ncbi:hypothetical protein NUG13_12555 [Bacillus subtilis]|uniref:hypothetical protein n=1 Tax=Bacillus subtilis group TaxID=653685 RepID=UPI00200BF62D|nr:MULTISPECIES: hypothetical protein [Bacillus subtilis group]MCR4362162.1 hypothetical protein [Bacillus subtilis]UQB84238.1 hypothetical protein KMZ31_20205 [Bacillus amyloliquefaciens]
MVWLRSEEEVDKIIEEMKNRTKGKYITQGVSFNKTCPRQMDLLKKALMSSVSFSGLGKELLAVKFSNTEEIREELQNFNSVVPQNIPIKETETPIEQPKLKSLGNFL